VSITTTPEWRHATIETEIKQAAWLTPGMPVWIARLDPALTRGDGWYVISFEGINEFSIRVPASFLYLAEVNFIPDATPPARIADDLNHVWRKSCEYVYDHLMARYGSDD
jgi:hypothetical protein